MKIAVWEPVQAHKEMMTVIWPTLKSMLMAGHKIVQLGLQSHKFTTAESSEFIEFLYAWAANKGLTL